MTTDTNAIPPPVTAGMHRLDMPLPNPSPDRRVKQWHCQPEFPAGRYRVRVYKRDATEYRTPGWEVSIVYSREYGSLGAHWYEGSWHSNNPGAAELAAALVPDPSLDGHLRYVEAEDYIHPREVLLALVKAGAVGEDAVRMAVENVRLQHELEDAKEPS